MHTKETPPASPDNIQAMDDELFEDDMVEIIEDEGDMNNISEGDEDYNVESDEAHHEIITKRDDAKCVFKEHKGSVFCCHLEPKTGQLAVTGGEDDMAYVWKTDTGEVVIKCTGHKDSVTCVAFSYDGTYVATGDMGGLIQVWRILTSSKVWETQVGDLGWLKWHHGANVLLGGTHSGDVYMWRIPAGDCKLLVGQGVSTECGLIFPDGKRAAIGYNDGSVRVFDMKAAKVLHHFSPEQTQTGYVTCMDYHADNNLLICGGADGRAVLLKSQTGKVVSVLDCRTSSEDNSPSCVEAVGFCRKSSQPIAATATLSGVLTIWDITRGVQRCAVNTAEAITKLVWVKNTLLLYAASVNAVIRRYDTRGCFIEKEIIGHSASILDISLSTDCKTLLASSDDSTARVFPVPRTFNMFPNLLMFSADGTVSVVPNSVARQFLHSTHNTEQSTSTSSENM